MPDHFRRGLPLLGSILLLASAGTAAAQEAATGEADNRSWEFEVEVGGTLFFGNRDQSIVATRTEIAWADANVESTVDLRFTYGESTDGEGVSEVNRRSWLVDSALDFRPGGLWRPFVTGRAESALERRIDRRYQGGVGVKYDNRIDRDNRTEFSLGVLAERTYRISTSTPSSDDRGDVGRLSSELRIRRTFISNRIGIDLQNAYRPVFDALGNFVLTSRNAFTLELTEVFGLRFSHQSNYDSGAKDRGADTNHDGELQISVVARF